MNKSTPIQQIREARGKCRGATALSCGGNRYCVFLEMCLLPTESRQLACFRVIYLWLLFNILLLLYCFSHYLPGWEYNENMKVRLK